MGIFEIIESRHGVFSAPLVGYPTLAYIGADVETGVKDAEVQTAALLKYHKEIRPDVLFPFMDLSVEAETLGLSVDFNPNDGPVVIEHPVHSTEDLKKPDGFSSRRSRAIWGLHRDGSRRPKSETDAVIGGYVASPFTLAGLLTGAEEIALKTLTEPDFCHAVLDFTTKICVPYAKAQAEAGADFVVVLEPTATLLSPELYETFVDPYVQRVIREIGIPVVLHVCGQTTKLIPSFVKNDVQGLSLDSYVNLAGIAPLVPKNVAILGNVSPVDVMLNMDAEGVYRATRELLMRMNGRKNYVASTGCDLPFAVKRENLLAFTRAVRDFVVK